MRKWVLIFSVLIPVVFYSSKKAVECEVNNTMFVSGEEIKYKALYNWGFIWLEAGEVTFNIQLEDYKGAPSYHISGIGGSYPSYDWIYKVRDRFESWVDTATLKPFRYIRDVKEGGRNFYNECFFSQSKGKAYCVTREQKKLPRLDTVPMHPCAFDPMTMIYYARTIDYSSYKVNDTIPIILFLDSKLYTLYIRYLGKEVLKLGEKTSYRCIKFSPKLVEGTIFKGGEGMTVWATDDKNRIPLYVEAPILVGTVKARIMSWKGLKNKFEAKVE